MGVSRDLNVSCCHRSWWSVVVYEAQRTWATVVLVQLFGCFYEQAVVLIQSDSGGVLVESADKLVESIDKGVESADKLV